MGALWSKKGNQFEKELEKLDKSITHTEYRQRTAHTNKRRYVGYLIYSAVFLELLLVSWYYFHKKPTHVLDKVVDSYPLVLPPLLGYLLSWTVSFYYTRRIKSDEGKLTKLRAQLKQKLEERKQATGFDTTQQLLSKYEKLTKNGDAPASPKAGAVPQPAGLPIKKGQPQLQQRTQHMQQPQHIQQTPPPQPSQPSHPPGGLAHPSLPPATRPPAPTGTPLPRPPMPTHRSWLDKLVDYVVGGEPQHSFALICSNCKAHNGLIPQSEMQSFQFRCRFCNHFNQNLEGSSSSSPSPSSSSSSSTSTPSSTPVSNTKPTTIAESKKNE